MRRIIFILMIALLPLRGWMGEAMATEMAAMNIIATKATNTPTKSNLHVKKGISDCDMHKADSKEQSSEKSTCTYCQVCHATGLVSTVYLDSYSPHNFTKLLAYESQFSSATVAFGQKPPIL